MCVFVLFRRFFICCYDVPTVEGMAKVGNRVDLIDELTSLIAFGIKTATITLMGRVSLFANCLQIVGLRILDPTIEWQGKVAVAPKPRPKVSNCIYLQC